MESLNLNNTYMKITDTPNFFPKFKYTEDNIPVGNSISLCISLHWNPQEKGQNFDLTKTVKGFPQCLESISGKFIWNVDDPINGLDVPAWTQKEIDVDCTDEEDCRSTCDDYYALYLNGKRGKKCFSYMILKSICITVEYDEVLNDFVFKGGCFEGGKHYLMEQPDRDKIYYFRNIKFEVRNFHDPVIKAGEYSNYSYSFGASMNWLAIFLNFLFWIAFLVFLGAVAAVFYYKKYPINSKDGKQVLNDKTDEMQD